jgi:RND family efflux transporter MFP subunit
MAALFGGEAAAQGASAPAAQAVPAPSAGAAPPAGRAVARPMLGCLISPERVADIGSPVVGIVADMKVDSGDTVHAGQPLVLLQSEVERAGLQAAQARSAIEADVYAAKANVMLAHQRYARAVELEAEGFVSSQAVEQARTERDVAEQKLQQARGQQQVTQEELRVVQAQLGQRTVRSPFAGVVVERYANVGERVEERPLLRVAMLDPLRVELVMPANRWGSVAVGHQLAIVPELPGASVLTARVTHVDRLIDAASNTFRVRMALPNPGHRLPAGARCKVDESRGHS